MEAFAKSLEHLKKTGGQLHFMGLYSTGTVHSYFEHLHALLDLAKQNKLPAFCIFLPTARTLTKRGVEFYAELEKNLAENYPNIKIASIIGRGSAMDRGGDWGKTRKTYELLPQAKEIPLIPLPNI